MWKGFLEWSLKVQLSMDLCDIEGKTFRVSVESIGTDQALRPSGDFIPASGWGITGNKGRCYDFWTYFRECMSRCREPKDCSLLREDYLQCPHHAKEFQRRNRVYKEEQRQIRAAARKAKEGGDHGEESHG